MAKRISTIVLKVKSRKKAFKIDHAERLLNMRNNGGWVIADSTNFELKNGAIVRRDKKEATKAEKETNDKQSDKA